MSTPILRAKMKVVSVLATEYGEDLKLSAVCKDGSYPESGWMRTTRSRSSRRLRNSRWRCAIPNCSARSSPVRSSTSISSWRNRRRCPRLSPTNSLGRRRQSRHRRLPLDHTRRCRVREKARKRLPSCHPRRIHRTCQRFDRARRIVSGFCAFSAVPVRPCGFLALGEKRAPCQPAPDSP